MKKRAAVVLVVMTGWKKRAWNDETDWARGRRGRSNTHEGGVGGMAGRQSRQFTHPMSSSQIVNCQAIKPKASGGWVDGMADWTGLGWTLAEFEVVRTVGSSETE